MNARPLVWGRTQGGLSLLGTFSFPTNFKNPALFPYPMARNNKVHMPQSTAGITRYFDEYKGKVSLRPQTVIAIIVIVIVIAIIVHSFFGRGI